MRKRLGSLNWKSALGEVALIVISILLALAASSWYEGRKSLGEERQMLSQLRQALAEDQAALQTVLGQVKEAELLVSALETHLQAGGAYTPSLNRSFGASYGLRLISLNRAPFESLRSRGLGLIHRIALRSEITRLYALTYANLDLAQTGQRSVIMDALRPYYLKHFRRLEFNSSATPLDYRALQQDAEFLNLLDYRLQVLRLNDIPSFEKALEGATHLMASIEQELNRE